MKIVSREEFLRLPAGTAYIKTGEICHSDRLEFFEDIYEPDLSRTAFDPAYLIRPSGGFVEGETYPYEAPRFIFRELEEFDDAQFAILDANDLLQLRSLIDRALDVAGGSTP